MEIVDHYRVGGVSAYRSARTITPLETRFTWTYGSIMALGEFSHLYTAKYWHHWFNFHSVTVCQRDWLCFSPRVLAGNQFRVESAFRPKSSGIGCVQIHRSHPPKGRILGRIFRQHTSLPAQHVVSKFDKDNLQALPFKGSSLCSLHGLHKLWQI